MRAYSIGNHHLTLPEFILNLNLCVASHLDSILFFLEAFNPVRHALLSFFALLRIACHNDKLDFFVPNHLPEVRQRMQRRRLGGYVCETTAANRTVDHRGIDICANLVV
jgi:hypothetical protein